MKKKGEIIIAPTAKPIEPEQVFKDKWQEGQRHPIGLIICRTKDEETVHYALGDLKREIFVAEYKVKLPSEEEIKRYLL